LDWPKELEQGDWEGEIRLGPWAAPVDSPIDLPKPDLEPYPTPESVKRASVSSHQVAAALLEHLIGAIHRELGVGLPRRFWEVFLTWHVIHIAGVVEDIRVRCGSLAESASSEEIIYGTPRNGVPEPPQDVREYILKSLTRTDLRIRIMDLCCRSFLSVGEESLVLYHEDPPAKEADVARRSALKRAAERVLFKVLTGMRTSPAVLWDRYRIGTLDLFRLARFGLPLFRPDPRLIELPSVPADFALRERVFHGLPEPYDKVLTNSFPVMALEGLPATLQAANEIIKNLKGKTKYLYTFGQIWGSIEPMRAAASLLAGEGARITSIQHGGTYAAYDAFSAAFIDVTVPDRFITWGWENLSGLNGTGAKFTATPSLYLSRLASEPVGRMDFQVLCLVFSEDLYPKWLYSPIFPELARDYFIREKVIFDGLKDVPDTAVKPLPYEHGWHQNEWIGKDYPQFKLLLSGQFTQWARRSRFTIVDYSGTGFLELLAMDRPFMVTWNRRWFGGPAPFEQHMDRLAQVGVFYDDPNDLVAAYHQIESDIDSWWAEPERREAVRAVARAYAWTSKNALSALQEVVTAGYADPLDREN